MSGNKAFKNIWRRHKCPDQVLGIAQGVVRAEEDGSLYVELEDYRIPIKFCP